MDIKHSVISFFGKPNVGKSTLFNLIQKKYYSITSFKPQTTRNWICSFLDFDNEHQSVIIDTPGFHVVKNKLDIYINKMIYEVFKLITTACFMIDISRDVDNEDFELLKKLFSYKSINKKILIINKIDKVTDYQNKLENVLKQINEYKFDNLVCISANQNLNVDSLLNILKQDCQYEDLNISFFKEPVDEFTVSEIIRQEIIFLLKKELPYSIYVEITKFKYDQETNFLDIDGEIVVEKESQKSIVIGKNGQMVKNIGINSRKKLLDIFDCKINLKLFVKVKKDWRNNETIIKRIYKNNP